MKPEIAIDSIPIYMDGSDGSIWSSRDGWADIFTSPDLAARRFVRVSDVLRWLEANGVDVPRCPIAALVEHSASHFGEWPDAKPNTQPNVEICQAENPDHATKTSD